MWRTERLIIRNFTLEDADTVCQLLQCQQFMEYSDSGPLTPKKAMSRFQELINNSDNQLGKKAVVLPETGQIIGYCGIEPFTLDGHQEYELGFRLISIQRGKGYATEAALSVIERYKQEQLYAYVKPSNKNSINVLQKLGFIEHGRITTPEEQLLFTILRRY